MKQLKKTAIWSLPLFLFLAACNKEAVKPNARSSSQSTEKTPTGATNPSVYPDPSEFVIDPETYGLKTFTFHYGGQSYAVSANFQLDADQQLQGAPVIDNNFNTVKEIVNDLGEVGFLINHDSRDVYIYHGNEQLKELQEELYPKTSEKALKYFKKDLPIQYYTCNPFYRMYEHINYGGQVMFEGYNGSGMLGGNQPTTNMWSSDVYNVLWVGSSNNDRLSSIFIKGGELFGTDVHEQYITIFKRINFEPVTVGISSLTFSAAACTVTLVKDLREYYIWQFFFFGENWNDEVSSYKAYFNVY